MHVPASGGRRPSQCEPIASPAESFDRLDRVGGIELAAQPPHQYFDHIAVALRLLVVKALRQLGLGNNLAGTQHQVLENAIFESRQLHRSSIDFDGLSAS